MAKRKKPEDLKQRDPYWRERRALGHQVVPNKKRPPERPKHRGAIEEDGA